MKIDILTIFPKMFDSPFAESIVKIAQEKGITTLNIHNLRKWTTDKHKTVDDKPFGGGAGMIMMIEPIYKALEELDPSFPVEGSKDKDHKACRVLLTAKGERIVQKKVRELSKKKHLILICGHYEGIDHRVHEHLVDECISIGDFVLSGGEIPAMAVVDSVIRLIPGVLGNVESTKEESFSIDSEVAERKYIEYPQYTRPAVFKMKSREELKVPDVLLSGDHGKIRKWRRENSK